MKIAISILVFTAVAITVYYYNILKQAAEGRVRGYKDNIKKLLKNSYASIKHREIIRIEILMAVLGCALLVVTGELLLIFAVIPALIVFPRIYISSKQKKYVREYKEGLTGFLESVTSNLKAGLSIVKSLQVVSERDKGPVGREMEIILKKLELGKSLSEALMERIPRPSVGHSKSRILLITQAWLKGFPS